MGWKIEVLIVVIKCRHKGIGGAERKLLDPYLGKWVYLGDLSELLRSLVARVWTHSETL